jgi:hypothetical protein
MIWIPVPAFAGMTKERELILPRVFRQHRANARFKRLQLRLDHRGDGERVNAAEVEYMPSVRLPRFAQSSTASFKT